MTTSVEHFSGRIVMVRCHKQPLGWVFVSGMIGIISFLIFVVLANILTYYISSTIYHAGVLFLNENFWLLILIAIIFFAGNIFGAFPFPLNLPAPIIRAMGSVFCIAFFLRGFQWMDMVTGTHLYSSFWLISFLVIPLIFLIVLASGYYEIIRQLWWQPKPEPGADARVVHEIKSREQEPTVSDEKSWEDIGSEFRLMLYDIIHLLRQEIHKK
jgi:hypothetical protein